MSRTIALVTGASRGIGQTIAMQLAKAGYFVVGTATSEAGVARIERYLKDSGGIGRILDVRSASDIDELFTQIESIYGHVEVLVNNAGITQDSLLMRMSTDAFSEVVDVNLKAVFHTSKRSLKGMMKARHGRIINITSVVAQMGNAGQANYAASKAGVEGFTRSLAREVGSRQITVNCVAAGIIESDMTSELDERYKQAMLDAVPVARLGQPEDVAATVLFLASNQASYITGAVIPVNGGMYL